MVAPVPAVFPCPGCRGSPVLRKAILAAAESPRLQRVVRRHGMRLGAGRFVAGETLDQAVVVLRLLNDKGLRANTTLLGEGVGNEAETRAVVDAYKVILDRIAAERAACQRRPQAHASRARLRRGARAARTSVSSSRMPAASANFVRLDMEESSFVDATLRVYRALREDGHENVGTVLQSYLYRTPADLEGAPRPRAEPPLRQGRIPRAARRRLPREEGRRRRLSRG